MLLIKYGILIAAVAATLFSRRWALAVFAFFLPLTQWLPAIPVPGLNAINLMLIGVIARALAVRHDHRPVGPGSPILVPAAVVLIFVTWSWVRIQFFETVPYAFVENEGYYGNFVTFKEILIGFVIYGCSRRLTRTPQQRRDALTGVVAGYAFESLTAAREFLFSGSWRATGHMGQPNKLGDFLSAYMMLPAGLLLSRASGLLLVSASTVVFGLLGLFGAVSRGALVASALAVCLMALVRRSGWIVVIAGAIATAPIWLPEKVMQRFESTVVEDAPGAMALDTEHEGRFELWQMARLMIADYPITGVGLNMFSYHLREYGYQARRTRSTHNIYLQLAVEQGIPATVGHVLMMLILAWLAMRVALAHPDPLERAAALGAFGMIISFMASSFFGDGFYENNLSGLFFIVAGVVVNQSRDLAATRALGAPGVVPEAGR